MKIWHCGVCAEARPFALCIPQSYIVDWDCKHNLSPDNRSSDFLTPKVKGYNFSLKIKSKLMYRFWYCEKPQIESNLIYTSIAKFWLDFARKILGTFIRRWNTQGWIIFTLKDWRNAKLLALKNSKIGWGLSYAHWS